MFNAVVNSSGEVRAKLPDNANSPFLGSYERQGKGVTVISLSVDDENWVATMRGKGLPVEGGGLQREASIEVENAKGKTKTRYLGACLTTATISQNEPQ